MEDKEIKVTTRTNKCQICAKRYKYPNYVFEPRDRICFTCEFRDGNCNYKTNNNESFVVIGNIYENPELLDKQ